MTVHNSPPRTAEDFADLALEAAAGVQVTDDTLWAASGVAEKLESLRHDIEQLRDHLNRACPNPSPASVVAIILEWLNRILVRDNAHLSHTSAGTDEPCTCAINANHFEDDTAV